MAALPELLDELTLDYMKHTCMDDIERTYEYIWDEFSSIHGVNVVAAQGTMSVAVSIDIEAFVGITSDADFVQKLYQEENLKLMWLSREF